MLRVWNGNSKTRFQRKRHELSCVSYRRREGTWIYSSSVSLNCKYLHASNLKSCSFKTFFQHFKSIFNVQLPQMPSKYDLQLGELIKRMLCKKPEDRPDVKHILRQPYIKQQISKFLEATKEYVHSFLSLKLKSNIEVVYNHLSCYWSNRKTAKSRKNAANSKPYGAGSDASAKSNHDVQQQCLNSESKSRGRKVWWNGNPRSLLFFCVRHGYDLSTSVLFSTFHRLKKTTWIDKNPVMVQWKKCFLTHTCPLNLQVGTFSTQQVHLQLPLAI